MVIDEKTLSALMNEEFIRECKEIKLTPTSASSNKPVHVGPGSITLTNNGSFLIKTYCQGDIHPKEVLAPFINLQPGRLIEHDQYYQVQARDFVGNSWQSDPVLPEVISGFNFSD